MRRLVIMSLATSCAFLAPPEVEAQRATRRNPSAELGACRRSDACVAVVAAADLSNDRWAAAVGSAPVRTVRYGAYRRRGDADVHLAIFESPEARDRFVQGLRRIGDARVGGELGIESVLPIDARGIVLRVVRVRTVRGDESVRARVEAIVRAQCPTAQVSALSSMPDTLEVDLDSGCGPIVDVPELAARLAREAGVRSAEPERIGAGSARR
jgi:hypothetical protein